MLQNYPQNNNDKHKPIPPHNLLITAIFSHFLGKSMVYRCAIAL